MNAIKPHLPLIALIVIAAAVGAWYQFGRSVEAPALPEPAEAPADEAGPQAQASDAGAVPPATSGAPVSAPEASGGTIVVGPQNVLRSFDDPKWHFVFKAPATLEFGVARAEDGDITQISFVGDEGTIFVGRQTPIAEPSLQAYETETLAVAGQSVTAHRYEKPNENYAYYLYFTLVSGNYEYYVSIRSAVADETFADDFLKRIQAK